MDMSTTPRATDKRATTPKHGKKPENRLYSVVRRGNSSKSDRDGGGAINPDASIRVAAVCGNDVLLFDKSRNGVRERTAVMQFENHGAAMLYAADHDEMERRLRTPARDESTRVLIPFYQVKVAGVVTEHTNVRQNAHLVLRDGAARPKELWLVSEGGSCELLDRIL